MKKIIIYILTFLLSIGLVAAAGELQIMRDSYVGGETIQAYVSGIGSLSSSQISLLNNNSESMTISSPNIKEYRDGEYFIYFDLNEGWANGSYDGTYTLLAGSLRDNFTMVSGNDAISIKPGIIVLNENDDQFSIEIKTILRAATVVIDSSNSTILKPRKSSKNIEGTTTYTLYIDYEYNEMYQDEEITLTYADEELGYTIPIIFPDLGEEEEVVEEVVNETETNETVEEEVVEEETAEVEALSFLVTSDEVSLSITPDNIREDTLSVQNILDETLTDLTFTFTGDLDQIVSLDITEVESLEADEILEVNLYVNQDADAREGTYEGDLVFGNDEYSVTLPFTIEVTTAEEEEVEEETTEAETEVEEISFDSEGTGLGEEEESNGSTVIGVILILMLLGLIVLVALKLKQKPHKEFKEVVHESKKK